MLYEGFDVARDKTAILSVYIGSIVKDFGFLFQVIERQT